MSINIKQNARLIKYLILQPLDNGACFTAHQSVEKSLKSFLLSSNRFVARIHDLSALVERCKEIDDSFEE